MKMPKASEADRDRFRELMAAVPGVEVKPMFGQLGGFVNGNMCAGLFGYTIGVKLEQPAAAELVGLGGGPFGPEERPMSGWTTIPDGLDAVSWVERGATYVSTFPPKVRKSK